MANEHWRPAFACLGITDPLVAWLVYRGEMVSAPSAHHTAWSFWHSSHMEVLSSGRADRYQREVVLELFRQEEFPNKVGRLAGFYCFPDEAAARRASVRWGSAAFRMDQLAEIALSPASRVSVHDATWISRGLSVEDKDWMRRYWNGDLTDDPVLEVIVDGRAYILGTTLRAEARRVVAATWPNSLPLLELARVAAWLQSDLGLIAAMPRWQPDGARFDYFMNFQDATDEEFLERLRGYVGPANREDMPSNAELVLPDLQSRGFILPWGPAGSPGA